MLAPVRRLPLTLILSACSVANDDATIDTGDDIATGDSTTSDSTTNDSDSTTSDSDPTTDDERALFVPGRMGNQAFILRVSPSTGVVEPFGPALPIPADDLSSPTAVARPDQSRVVVTYSQQSESPLGTLLVGDGGSWKVVTKYNEHGLGGNTLADDASLFWFDAIDLTPNAPTTFQATVITTDGAPVFTGPPLDGTARFDAFTFAPEGTYFTFRDPARGYVLRTLDGVETELPLDFIHSLFATSLIVEDGATLQWVDLSAQPLDVPGFAADDDSVSTGYQIVGDQLSRLDDRVVTPVQKVPIGMRPGSVHGDYDGFVLGRPQPDAAWSTIGVDGTVIDAFTPEPSNDPMVSQLRTFTAAACGNCEMRSVVFRVRNVIVYDDVDIPADSSLQVWRLDSGAAALGQSVVSPWQFYDIFAPRGFLYSDDGAFLVWIENGKILRLDVAADVVTPIGDPYTVIEL